MRLHLFQHVSYEGLDRIADWAASRGHSVTETAFQNNDVIPDLAEFDGLIIMGGPMGVYESESYPWMSDEMAAIRGAIGAKKRVLGICLGSQLIAGALGARVYPQKQKEIGWWPVDFLPESRGTPLAEFGAQAMMFHWHGDTFDLPAGATLLASSKACAHQAYIIGRDVLALQFHPEISAGTIDRWIGESNTVKHPKGYVMSAGDMKRLAPEYLPALALSLDAMLDEFFA